MAFSKIGLVAVSLAALVAAGCSSTRFSSMNDQPAPLQPAPSGNVTASTTLPPPAAPGTTPTDPAGFPAAPGASTDVASITPDPATSAPDITTGNVVGAWNASVSGQSCQMITSLTKLGANNRAASRQCAAPIDGVKSWNVAGKQLSLYDESGSVVARLYSSGPEKFDGQTSTGLPISLSR
jgi:Protease inhibitor Inh